jgi:hypothetical protein
MTIATDQFARLERRHVLAAIAQLDAGATTRFADSTKFDVLYKKRHYAPKEVGGLALEALANRAFGPKDFKGGKGSPCFNALSRCGFTIVPKRIGEQATSLADLLSVILDLQTRYTSRNTSEMKRRGDLIRHALPDLIRDNLERIEPVFSAGEYECAVEGSDGVGRKNESPWVRIYDPAMSPSATHGWYVVLHFSRDGERTYVALGCGATRFVSGSLVNIPDVELEREVSWARRCLATSGQTVDAFRDRVDLGGNELSRQYEKAIAFAKSYEISGFDENEYWADLATLCKLLVVLYEQERLGKAPFSEMPELLAARHTEEQIARPKARRGKGQGRGLSYSERIAIERRAMEVAADGLLKRGFAEIKDKSSSESYDYSASKAGQEWFVEVKGTTSTKPRSFFITAPELKLHREHRGRTVLAIVSDIDLKRNNGHPMATGGKLELLVPWDPDEWDFEPTAYVAEKR